MPKLTILSACLAINANRPTACWIYPGHKLPSGYGQANLGGKVVLVHRYVFEKTNGPLRDGLVVTHNCGELACVNPLHLMATQRRDMDKRLPRERFWEKVERHSNSGCWTWTSSTTGGYGAFYDGIRNVPAHRFAYELRFGPIAAGLHLHHKCENRKCVNPDHLQTVTAAEHNTIPHTGKVRSRCPNGHDYRGNVHLETGGFRSCRICRRERNHRYYERKKRRHGPPSY